MKFIDDFANAFAGASEAGEAGAAGRAGDALTCKEATRRAFDRLAPTFDEDRAGRHARNLYRHALWQLAGAYRERLCREGREGRLDANGEPDRRFRVLDLGCGTGALTQLALDALPFARITGVDLSPAMVDTARERLGGRVRLFEADAEHLPFSEGSFDAVLANDVFHHLPDGPRASFEAWRVLSRDGMLVLGDTWAPAPARAVLNQFVLPHSAAVDACVRSQAELIGMLGAWFHHVEWERLGFDSCLAVARKSPIDCR